MDDENKVSQFDDFPINWLQGTNHWYIALKSYAKCVDLFYKQNQSLEDLKEAQKLPFVDRICQRELNKMREVAPSITYKEVLGNVRDDSEWRNAEHFYPKQRDDI
jgi:hypothetical protein